jgi:hypothetical protein
MKLLAASNEELIPLEAGQAKTASGGLRCSRKAVTLRLLQKSSVVYHLVF